MPVLDHRKHEEQDKCWYDSLANVAADQINPRLTFTEYCLTYDFSIQFLRVAPPDTGFADAWESLCHDLICVESPGTEIIRLMPPDRGVDMLARGSKQATQCKSHESGATGTLAPIESIKSLRTAVEHREGVKWDVYTLATNAWYSGNGFEQVLETAKELGLKDEQVRHLGPTYWDGLCKKYASRIEDRFYYRITAEERHVLEAFRKQRYYEHIIKDYQEKIQGSDFRLVLTNNRTPVEISIPFSPQLTVKNLVDVAKSLLGVSLDWTNFSDLSTSAGPSLSIAIDRQAQPFGSKIAELPIKSGDEIEFWIKLVWRDGLQKDGEDGAGTVARLQYLFLDTPGLNSKGHRGPLTIARSEAIVQNQIWEHVKQLLSDGAVSTKD